MAEKVYIPVRRGELVVVFAYIEIPSQRRWQFQAAAASDGPNGEMQRTGAVQTSDEEMEECAKLAKALPMIEAAFDTVRITDVGSYDHALKAESSAAVVSGSMLFTTTMYINFMRQYLVEETAITRYQMRAPEQRFDLGLSASIYDGLLKRHDLERAEEIVDADLPHANPPRSRHREWAHLYRLAAEVKLRRGEKDAGIELLEKAARFWPGEEIHRRIGNLHFDQGNLSRAIKSFKTAHDIEPLNGQVALRLAWWLQEDGQTDESKKFATFALEKGNEKARNLLERF